MHLCPLAMSAGAVLCALAAVPPIVSAQSPGPPGSPEPDPPSAPRDEVPPVSTEDGAEPISGPPRSGMEPSDEELLRMAERGEVILVWAERPRKPFDRDTHLRLTGEELAARGATDLATALSFLADISVRDVGRGGFNLDIRGARKGAVRVLIDGVAVSDPFYGNFDVSTIPITDIVEIRVSTSPASPIDGPGGPGGVVEVHTRDAIGSRFFTGRLTSDTQPAFGATATGRAAIADNVALRLSLSSLLGVRDYATSTDGVTVEDRRRAATGALRLEYRDGARRAVVDGFADTRRYVSPPAEELPSALFLLIDRETTGRIAIGFDDEVGADPALQIQAQTWLHTMTRTSRNFRDAALSEQVSAEEHWSLRAGGKALATRPIGERWRWVASVTVDHERARVEAQSMAAPALTRGDATVGEASAGAQLELGPFTVDAAGGVAVPMGVGRAAWPEAKLSARYRPHAVLEIEAIAARKGRVPSLRERYEGADANVELAPEMASHGELRAAIRPHAGVELTVAPYYRKTTGAVRVDPKDGVGLVNLGDLRVRGLDIAAKARLHRALEVGGSYGHARAVSGDLGADPLDRFPEHRVDGWTRATPVAWLAAMARARYTGQALDRAMRTPAYVLWDASASATLGNGWMAVVRMDDILDERPETRHGYRLPGRVTSLVLQGTWD